MKHEDYPPGTAAARGLAVCHYCLCLQRKENGYCADCGGALHLRKEASVVRTLAYTLAAMVLYIPANILPIMTVSGLGGVEENTIMGGVVTFWQMGSYPVAVIIFTASVLIPILKMVAIIALCRAAVKPCCEPQRMATIYRLTELVGRWSMVDVFVVCILVALVQVGSVMSIAPGPAALSFGGVVILTMIGAHCFDPRLIWDKAQRGSPPAQQKDS